MFCIKPSFRAVMRLMDSTLLLSLCVGPGPDFLAAYSHRFPFLLQLHEDNLGLFSTSPRYVLLWNINSIFCLGSSYLVNFCSYYLHLFDLFLQISIFRVSILIPSPTHPQTFEHFLYVISMLSGQIKLENLVRYWDQHVLFPIG